MGLEFQCWFCGEGIARDDTGAVVVSVEGLWRWSDGSLDEDNPLQQIYAHSKCAKQSLKGATMDLEPHIFGETE